MGNKKVFITTFILIFFIFSVSISAIFVKKIDLLQNKYNSSSAELISLRSENAELKNLVYQKDSEIQNLIIEVEKHNNKDLQKYYDILSQDDKTHENSIETIYIKNNVLYYNGVSFIKSDPLQVDDEYYDLLTKFYKLYDTTKTKISDQDLTDAGFDPWFVNSYGFAPFINLRFDAELISREYLLKRTCFEFAILRYYNNQIDKIELDNALNEFIEVREKASRILSDVTDADL